MSRLHLASALAAAIAVVPSLPAAADPVKVPGPGVCNGREITLEEGETLVERTLYFHGTSRVGNADGHQDANLGGAPRLFMDATAPTTADDKIYVARPTGVIGNANSNRNPHQGYWRGLLTGEERIVCAGAKVFAATTTGQLTIQLWVDQPRGTGTPTKSVSGSAPANQVNPFTVNFGVLDVVAATDLVVQLDSAPPGALAFYDSTARPSQLNYVVVVPAP